MKGIDMFLLGQELLRKEHEVEAEAKKHTLRGGSAGCLLPDGSTIGACPQEALARFLGYSMNSLDSQGYFDSGIANEMIWERNIAKAIEHEVSPYSAFRCEEDIPVKFRLDDKYDITGRPDLVLGHELGGEFKPSLGLELKGCFATGSGAKRLLGLEPDGKHICQAAFYMKMLDIPWTIPYTVCVTGDLNYFDKKNYNQDKLPLGKIEFPLRYAEDGNTIEYQGIDGIWNTTVITWEGILDFYRLIVDMFETKTVGVTRISDLDAFGQPVKFDYNLYNSFTAMVPVDQGWGKFISHCALLKDCTRYIKYSRRNYLVMERIPPQSPRYTSEGNFIGKYRTVDEARRVAYGR